MTRLKSLIIISVCVLLYATYYWVVPIAVNIQSKIPLIQKAVHDELGAQIEITNPKLKMGLLPAVWLDADYLGIKDKISSPLSISNPKIKIQLLPLFFGKVKIAYLSCDQLSAKLKFDKLSRFYIGNYLILQSSNPIISIENSKMNIGNYKVAIKDELQNKDIFINGDYLDLTKYTSKNYIKFSTNSNINVDGRTSVINLDVNLKLPFKKSLESNETVFDGTITNLNLSDFSPYIRKLSNNEIKKISGLVNIQADTKELYRGKRLRAQLILDKFSITGKDKQSSIHAKNKLNIISILNISKNVLKIEKLQILSKNLNASATGRIARVSAKNPDYDISIAIKNSRIEELIPFLPETDAINAKIGITAMKKFGVYADIDGNITINGKAEPDIIGDVFVTNAYVVKPLPDSVPKAKIKLHFSDKKMHMNVLYPVSSMEKVTVTGPINLYGDEYANLDIISSPNVDLQTVQSILNPLQQIFHFELGPLPVMKLQGVGNIKLRVKGAKIAPHLIGILNFNNTDASFNGLNFLIKNVDGSLFFNDTTAHFITKKATYDNKPLSIDGKCTFTGALDFDIITNGQELIKLISILKTSPMLENIGKLIPEAKIANGKINLNLKLKGKVKNIDDFVIGKTVFASGNVKLLGNDLLMKDLQLSVNNLFGNIGFDNKGADVNLYSFVDQSKIYIKGKIKNGNANLNVKGNIKGSPFSFDGEIKNLLKKDQLVNAKLIADNFDISILKNISMYPFTPKDTKYFIDKISNPTGKINLRATIKNNVLKSKIKLNDINFVYSSLDIPIKFFSGNIELNNDKLSLYKVNGIIDSMPVLVDGLIKNPFTNPDFNIYVNSKPTQKFIEKYINKNAIYPLKIKGDIIYSARISGTRASFSAKTEMNLQENASIYYMGSTLGDVEEPIRIFLDTNVDKNKITVQNFQYDKLISSQNNKEFVSPQLNAKGQIELYNKNIILHNFRIKTQNSTDAKIFNILFKKPMIKQGVFTSNILLNDSITSPNMLGNINFTGIDIPLLDTTIKDISLDFNQNDVNIKSKGEVFSNKFILLANMQNRLTAPYIVNDVDIYLGHLDVNQISKRISKLEIDTDMHKLSDQKQDIDISGLAIKKGKIKADSILVKNILAKDLNSEFSLNEKLVFALDNFKFTAAEGNVNGNFKYNLLNSNSEIELHIDNANANTMAEALFDLPNQIFGSLTGQVDLTCNGKSHQTCMDTLSGTGGFRVADGKMPKLGSLEYLLKAANLVKSGITGITINSLIELISPLKTGQFENINGTFDIKSGVADSVQIFSKGKDLSLFLTGTYNFSTLIADMEIFGRVSKKISNALGSIGNTSLNTLFNTIPGLNLDETNKGEFIKKLNKIPGFELNDKSYRIFSVEVYGDINGDKYVQSFKWIE